MSNKTIGIVGGGQLGRMLAQAAHKLGYTVTVLDPTPNSPAAQVADRHLLGNFTDPDKIKELARASDFLTFEIESANSTILEELQAQGKIIHPSPQTLSIIKNKFGQKQFLRKAHITVADFMEAASKDEIIKAAAEFDYPIVLKAKYEAYDGRGNALIEDETGIDLAMKKLQGRELYVEKFVVFEKELSVVAARSVDGTIAVYPVFETIHQNHICHTVIAPARIDDAARKQAHDLAIRALEQLKGVGVFCIEMFYSEPLYPTLDPNDLPDKTGSVVMINEIAPRVHNAGHLTIEGYQTSQFEQHIRAITGMDLGPTDMTVPAAVMVNILGERNGPALLEGFDEDWTEFATKNHLSTAIPAPSVEQIFVHIYGKIETRVERKMGHITIVADDIESALRTGEEIRKLIEI